MFLVALALLGQAEARSVAHDQSKISPPLEDVTSDKKFFGPPFPADYPEDKRPKVDPTLMNKLKGKDQPYPALQSKEDYDADYVKDENSDTGAWQAQFEYDRLRRAIAQKEADARRAAERAAREGKDVDDTQNADDALQKKIDDAAKDAADAASGEDKVKRAEDFDGPPSHEKLEELKKAVADAEERYEKQKKAFEECERQLEAAKKEVEDLKAKQVVMEQQLAADTKLWEEKKTTKLNLKKSRQTAATEKVKTALDNLAKAEKVKVAMEKALAVQKVESDKAQKSLAKEKADMVSLDKALTAASTKLQQLHGYKPANAASTATQSTGAVSWIKSLWR